MQWKFLKKFETQLLYDSENVAPMYKEQGN